MQVTSDQILGMFTFSIETGLSSACARNAGRSRSDLKPMCTVNGEIARSIHASSGLGLRKWLRKMMRPPGRQTRLHLARDGDRIGHDADQIRRVDDVERVVGELDVGGVHLEQPDVPDALAGDPLARLLEHRARQVDAGDRAVARIQAGVDAGADADLEHAVAGLDAHPLNGLDPAGMQRRTEREVVDRGELLVDAGDEVVFDRGDR